MFNGRANPGKALCMQRSELLMLCSLHNGMNLTKYMGLSQGFIPPLDTLGFWFCLGSLLEEMLLVHPGCSTPKLPHRYCIN